MTQKLSPPSRSPSRGDPPPGRRVEPGVDALDRDPLGPALGRGELRHRLAHVPGREQEALEPLRRVDLDHVPEDRPAADLDQRLRHRLGPLPQPRPAPAAEDDDRRLPFSSRVTLARSRTLAGAPMPNEDANPCRAALSRRRRRGGS